MANNGSKKELIKAVLKIATAIIAAGFGRKVSKEGIKNFNSWQDSKQSNKVDSVN